MRPTITAAIFALTTSVALARPRVAQNEDKDKEEEDSDGPEGLAALPMKLDDLIEVLVREAPDLVRAKIDRVALQNQAQGERRQQAWIGTTGATYSKHMLSE